MKKIAFIFSLSIATMVLSCGKDPVEPNNNCATPKSYAADVSPIIQSSCAINTGCHATGSTNGPGPLTIYAEVFNAITSIRTAVANGTMPKNSSLTNDQKNAIICWIDSGAPNN
jgi:hypothetical protein